MIREDERRQPDLKQSLKAKSIDLIGDNVIKCGYTTLRNEECKYCIIDPSPAKGLLYITNNAPYFISGHIRLRGRNQGQYPWKYLEMIDRVFGAEPNIIEACGRHVKDCVTVDINPEVNPTIIGDAQTLSSIQSNSFDRWRCDPPYSELRAQQMYNTELPNTGKLLLAGARVCKPGALLFLLLGPQNYQICPKGVKRIGLIYCSIVPNNEVRCLNIFYKYQ